MATNAKGTMVTHSEINKVWLEKGDDAYKYLQINKCGQQFVNFKNKEELGDYIAALDLDYAYEGDCRLNPKYIK